MRIVSSHEHVVEQYEGCVVDVPCGERIGSGNDVEASMCSAAMISDYYWRLQWCAGESGEPKLAAPAASELTWLLVAEET